MTARCACVCSVCFSVEGGTQVSGAYTLAALFELTESRIFTILFNYLSVY